MIRINRSRLIYTLIFILIMFDLDFFYLVNTAKLSIFGVTFLDAVFILHMAIFVITFILNKGFLLIKINKWNLFMICPFILAVLSAYAGTITYGQPFIKGFVSQREWLGCMVMFFPISTWLEKKYINLEGLKKTVYFSCIIMMFIYILQYFLGEHLVFTYTISSERYGEARYFFETAYLILLSGITIDNIVSLQKKNYEKKHVFGKVVFIATVFFVLAVVMKGRMLTISAVISLLLSLLLLKIGRTKKIILVFCLMIATTMFLFSDIASDAIGTLQGTSSENDTLSVRNAGREYYMDIWSDNTYSIIFGCGSPNLHWKYAQEVTNPYWKKGGSAKFYLIDNGIFGEIFIYGLCGLLWFIIGVVLSIRQSFRIYKCNAKVGYFMFIIADVIACVTLVPNCFGGIIVFPLYLAMIRQELLDEKEKQEENC